MTYSSGVGRTNPNVSPIFIRLPAIAAVKLSNQLCDRTPTTTIPIPLFTAGEHGAFIESIEVYPLGANVKSVLRLYGNAPEDSNYFLLKELALPIVTSAPADDSLTGYPLRFELFKVLFPASPVPATPNFGVRLPPGYQLSLALGVAIASGVNVVLTGGDY